MVNPPEKLNLLNIHPGLVDRTFGMNPKRDELIGGGDLENGMTVLIAADIHRYSLLDLTERDIALVPNILITNRWCTVRKLRRIGSKIHFVGEYQDGSTHPRTYKLQDQWVVKKKLPLIAVAPEEIEHHVSAEFTKGIQRQTEEDLTEKRKKIVDLLREVSDKQRSIMVLYGTSESFAMDEIIEKTTDKIMEL